MKRFVSLLLALLMLLSVSAAGAESVTVTADDFELTGDPASLKFGFILLGDENEGYTYAHILGIKTAMEHLGIPESQVVWKYGVPNDSTTYDAAADLADSGCNVIFSNSYGHQSYMQQAAEEFTDVKFIAVTGDTAKAAAMDNFANGFPKVYESRYVSGVVAGLKIKELIEAGKLSEANYDADGNVKLGYVGAYPYAEVVSGYTGFFLGVRSIVPNVVMSVSYVNSWFDLTGDYEAASALIADGCVVISQHSDATGAPSACQAALDAGKECYSVGYNISMLSVAPTAALTSATSNWVKFYEYAMKTALNGDPIAYNWTAGYDRDAVAITELGPSCAAGTAEKVEETIAAIKSGEIKVFSTANYTVGGETVTSALATDTDGDYVCDKDEAVWDGEYHESYFQSAPAFGLRIDGITELN